MNNPDLSRTASASIGPAYFDSIMIHAGPVTLLLDMRLLDHIHHQRLNSRVSTLPSGNVKLRLNGLTAYL